VLRGLSLVVLWLFVAVLAIVGDWDVMYHLSYGLLLLGVACFAWAHLNVKLTDFRRSSRGVRALTPFTRAPGLTITRWASVGTAIAFTSSGIT
jgi:hypothetical protein